MYDTGKTEDDPFAKGLAFLIQPKLKKQNCAIDFKTHSKRVINMNVNLQGKDVVTIINAYAYTSNAEDGQVG